MVALGHSGNNRALLENSLPACLTETHRSVSGVEKERNREKESPFTLLSTRTNHHSQEGNQVSAHVRT